MLLYLMLDWKKGNVKLTVFFRKSTMHGTIMAPYQLFLFLGAMCLLWQ